MHAVMRMRGARASRSSRMHAVPRLRVRATRAGTGVATSKRCNATSNSRARLRASGRSTRGCGSPGRTSETRSRAGAVLRSAAVAPRARDARVTRPRARDATCADERSVQSEQRSERGAGHRRECTRCHGCASRNTGRNRRRDVEAVQRHKQLRRARLRASGRSTESRGSPGRTSETRSRAGAVLRSAAVATACSRRWSRASDAPRARYGGHARATPTRSASTTTPA